MKNAIKKQAGKGETFPTNDHRCLKAVSLRKRMWILSTILYAPKGTPHTACLILLSAPETVERVFPYKKICIRKLRASARYHEQEVSV